MVSDDGGWEWAAALPEWVRAKGWTARSYRNGRLAASYYHVSLFDVPPDYWAQVTDALSSPGQSLGQSQGQQQQQPPLASSAARAGSGVGEGGEGAVAVVGLMQRLSLGGGKGESLLEGEEEADAAATATGAAAAAIGGTGAMTCSRCRVSLPVAERVAHYQSPWHLLNLRRSLAKRAPLSLADYEASRHTSTTDGSGSSSAGNDGNDSSSDSDGEGEQEEEQEEMIARESAMATVVVPPGAYAVTVWSPLLAPDPKRSTPSELLAGLRGLGHRSPSATGPAPPPKWAVLMLRSGRFAGAVFEGPKVLAHKAFRRYTQRAKQGGSQSSYDKKGKKAQSVGAQLRRHGEQQTKEDVRAILAEWAELLGACDLVFLSVPKAMRGVLLGGGEADAPLLRRDDPRLRPVPFMVEAPSFAEVQAICNKFATVRFSAPPPPPPSTTTAAAAAPPPFTTTTGGGLHPIHEGTEEGAAAAATEAVVVEPDPDWHAKLAQAVRRGKAEAAAALLAGLGEDEGRLARVLAARDLVEGEGASLLHLAAAKGNVEVIDLLLAHGASPLTLDHRERPPYFLATARPARDAFRRARGRDPDRWDWERAGVPEALTDELEERRKEKAKEKKRRAKAKKQQEKARTAQQVGEAEAARAAAEAAATAESSGDEEDEARDRGKPRCDSCGKVVKVLYTRLEYIYCSTDCVQNHKRALLAEAAMRRLGGGGGGK